MIHEILEDRTGALIPTDTPFAAQMIENFQIFLNFVDSLKNSRTRASTISTIILKIEKSLSISSNT